MDQLDRRISWEECAIQIAEVAARRSEDLFQRVGACAMRHDHSVASVGFNGTVPGYKIDWSDRDKRRPKIIHAEVNCLKWCRPQEVEAIATTILPCNPCFMNLASYGIKKIIYKDIYERDSSTLELAKEFDVELIQIKEEKQKSYSKEDMVKFANWYAHKKDKEYIKDSEFAIEEWESEEKKDGK